MIDQKARTGNPVRFTFAKPKVGDYDFSFSGLKTSILYFLQKQMKQNSSFIEENEADLCASIQHTIVEMLMEKLKLAASDHNIRHIAIAGGVSANSKLRKSLEIAAVDNQWQTYIPDFEYCTDNGAMIAITGYFKFKKGEFAHIGTLATARKHLSKA